MGWSFIPSHKHWLSALWAPRMGWTGSQSCELSVRIAGSTEMADKRRRKYHFASVMYYYCAFWQQLSIVLNISHCQESSWSTVCLISLFADQSRWSHNWQVTDWDWSDREIFTMSSKVKTAVFIGGFVTFTLAALFPVTVYPRLYPEVYRK